MLVEDHEMHGSTNGSNDFIHLSCSRMLYESVQSCLPIGNYMKVELSGLSSVQSFYSTIVHWYKQKLGEYALLKDNAVNNWWWLFTWHHSSISLFNHLCLWTSNWSKITWKGNHAYPGWYVHLFCLVWYKVFDKWRRFTTKLKTNRLHPAPGC
jgi:hypothetical protein